MIALMKTKICLALINLLLVLISGCSTISAPASPLAEPGTNSLTGETATQQITRTPMVISPNPALTSTLTPTQTLLPSTATLLPSTPTRTALPILTFQEGKNLILTLMHENPGCQLPCLWGFHPGKSSVEDVRAFVAQFGYGDKEEGDISTGAHDYGPYGGVSIFYTVDDTGIVIHWSFTLNKKRSRISYLDFFAIPMKYDRLDPITNQPAWAPARADDTFNKELHDFVLSSILTTYGPPAGVRLIVDPGEPDRPDIKYTAFYLMLYFPEQGIYAQYETSVGKTAESYVSCPSEAAIDLKVWDPQAHISFETLIDEAGIVQDAWNASKSLEEATSIDIEQFYQMFSSPNQTTCLESPQSLWNWWEK